MALNDARIRALKPSAKPTKHGDAGGLLLVVNPTGSKLWRVVYRFEGKQKQLSLGTWPEVSLAQARSSRDAARKLLASGIESGIWSADAIEAELAHMSGNAVRRAYHRASYWDERIQMAGWWSERITEIVNVNNVETVGTPSG